MQQQNETLARYYAKKKKIKKRRAVAFYTFLIVLFICVICVLSLTVFFNINKITVNGNDHYSTKEIISASGFEKGQNLFRLNKFKIIDKLKEKLPYLDTVEIDRKLPVEICINVTETEPFLCVDTSGGAYLVDASLKVLEKTDELPLELAHVTGIKVKDIEVGGQLIDKNGAEKHLLQLTTVLYEHMGSGKVTKINIKETYNIVVTYEDRVEITFGTLENIDEKVRLVKYVLEENSKSEHAEIDVSSGKLAYYEAVD